MRLVVALGLFLAGLAVPSRLQAEDPPPLVREVLVPFDDLNVLLQDQPRRVLLSREEYEALQKKAVKTPDTKTPYTAQLLTADYTARIEKQQALIQGTLTVDVLAEGLHAVALPLSGVGLRAATLDGKPAALGRDGTGPVRLFVEGRGTHKLELQMQSPLETTAARQMLHFRLPTPPSSRLRLTVPGDVEVKAGVAVIERVVDAQAHETRFELLPPSGETTLEMSLNSHLQRQERAVVARSVAIDEVTQAYERLHATVNLEVLHRAIDGVQFAVPEGFEVTDVASPKLARWALLAKDGRKVLDIHLREATTEPVGLNLLAVRSPAKLQDWSLPRLEPLDVVGQVAVVGLLLDERLRGESIAAQGLIPIDVSLLQQAMPATVFRADPGAPALVPVVAYYAPQGTFSLAAQFTRPPAKLTTTTNLLLQLQDQAQEVRGGLSLVPENEPLFSFDLAVPAGWTVTGMTRGNEALPYELRPGDGAAKRIRVRLPQKVAPGSECTVNFTATRTPADWLGTWDARRVEFPRFEVQGATRALCAIAIDAGTDRTARPEKLEKLTPLDEAAKKQYGLSGMPGALAYRCEDTGYAGTFIVERVVPRLSARTFSFVVVEPDSLACHDEVIYQIENARTRQLSLSLPESTPESIAIRGLDGLRIKEYVSQKPENGMRRWTVLLEEAQAGKARLAVDYQTSLPSPVLGRGAGGEGELPTDATSKSSAGSPHPNPLPTMLRTVPGEGDRISLPILRADAVAYQSGLVSIEGSPELDVQVEATNARRVDVGEAAEADYQPGRRLLGVFGFAGEKAESKVNVAVRVARHPGYALHPALVERAELTTLLSAEGASVTSALFRLRTKALFLEIRLPEGSELWSAVLDGQPIKPQRDAKSILVSLPAATGEKPCELQAMYYTPVRPVSFLGRVELTAPALQLHADAKAAAVAVPLATLQWVVRVPDGFEAAQAGGTLETHDIQPPTPAASIVGGLTYVFSGGCGEMGMLSPAVYSARETARRPPAACMAPPASEPKSASAPTGAAVPMERHELRNKVAAKSESELRIDLRLKEKEVEKQVDKLAKADEAAAGKEAAADAKADDQDPELARRVRSLEGALKKVDDEAAARKAAGEKPAVGVGGMIAIDAGKFSAPPASFAPESLEMPLDNSAPLGYPDSAAWKALSAKRAALRKTLSLSGFRSLQIDLQDDDRLPIKGEVLHFASLGAEPRLSLALAHRARFDTLGWAVALAIFAWGVARTRRSVLAKVRFVVVVGLLAALVPLLTDHTAAVRVANFAFFAAAALVPYYLLAGAVGWTIGLASRLCGCCCRSAAAPTATLLLLCALISAARAETPSLPSGNYTLQIVESAPPLKIPDDVIVRPYDPNGPAATRPGDKLLVPYDKYVELWNRAHPDQKIESVKRPAAFALAGATYRTTLEGDDTLLVSGELAVDLFQDAVTGVPLTLDRAVLARAEVDGKPAQLNIPAAVPMPMAQNAAPEQCALPAQPVLYVSGKGRHALRLELRLRLERAGGWRIAAAALPAAPAAVLSITVPKAQTEVRLGQQTDRPGEETARDGQTLETALGEGGTLRIQWRPQVSEGQVDRDLTAASNATLDVQEDGLRLTWHVQLEFRRGSRETFRLSVPKELLVEKVEGENVRGWEVKAKLPSPVLGRGAGGEGGAAKGKPAGNSPHPDPLPEGEGDLRAIDITLLKAAHDRERFTLRLARRTRIGPNGLQTFDVPAVGVEGAVLHNGQLTIRRSPLVDLRTVDTRGVSRIDLPSRKQLSRVSQLELAESPLGFLPYQAFQFVTVPFTLRLAAAVKEPHVTADVQSLLRIAEYQRTLESRVLVHVSEVPLYVAEMALPEGLDLRQVTAPGEFQWAVTPRDGRRVLSIYLAAGRSGDVPIVLRGELGQPGPMPQVELPRLEVLHVEQQPGDIAVQSDPAFDLEATNLVNCQSVLPERLYGWLQPQQRAALRTAIQYRRPDYRGTLRLVARKPDVACTTITNVRFTDRALEETILLDFAVQHAGVREVLFLMPLVGDEPRIQVPMLREKTIERVTVDGAAWRRVRLQLQDEVIGQLRVLVSSDRALGDGEHAVPIPVVQTGRTDRQFVALENAGRDEVVPGEPQGLAALSMQQREWQVLNSRLGNRVGQAWFVTPGATQPRLVFRVQPRQAVEVSGARIELAETVLVLDAHGAYRAQVTYRMNNATEQFLDIDLPDGAELWTARVAGEPVKPVRDPAQPATRLRIPLVKTSAGDLDYPLVLKYAGTLPPLAWLDRVKFPLVRTGNIHVELSHVELHLPDTHRWYDFDGTMRLVDAEVAQVSSEMNYRTKQVERLIETRRHGNAYAQQRADINLKNLSSSLNNEAVPMDGLPGRAQQQQAQLNNLIAKAQQETAANDATEQTGETYNRGQLNELYLNQQTGLARNSVQQLRDNWNADGDAPVATGKGNPFRGEWFDANKLVQPKTVVQGEAGEKLAEEKPGQAKGERYFELGDQAGQAGQGRWQMQGRYGGKAAAAPPKPRTPDDAGFNFNSLPPVAMQVAPQAQPPARPTADDSRKRYRERLEQQDALQQAANGPVASEQAANRAGNGFGTRGSRQSAPYYAKDDVQYAAPGPNNKLQRQGNQQAERALSEAIDRDGQAVVQSASSAPDAGGGEPQEQSKSRGDQLAFGVGVNSDAGLLSDAPTGTLSTTSPAAPPAGLASLDLELPSGGPGPVYHFTTPRGEVEITARVIAESLAQRFFRLLLAAAAVVAALVALMIARRGSAGWLTGRTGSTVLIVAGGLALLFGVLPVVGLIALVVGMAVKVRRALEKRLPAGPNAA